MTKSVIVTGASSGVGKAATQLMQSHGWRVVGLDVKEPDFPIDEFHLCDLSRPHSIDAVLGKLHGRYASVLNVAGVSMTAGAEVTVKVNFLGLRHFIEGIWSRIEDRGAVVNVTSVLANNWRNRRAQLADLLATDGFDAGVAWWRMHAHEFKVDPYVVSKEAVAMYTMVLAGRGRVRGIHVNAVAPGLTETPLFSTFVQEAGTEQMRYHTQLVGRVGKPEEIAEAITMLAERKLGWVNGVHLNVDGGLTAAIALRWDLPEGSAH
jgi:NAD(P)-dependent dehydrogenase (short-subunit alcohol dehydrogenase family)